MEGGEYLFSGNAWFNQQLAGPDGQIWRRARKLFLFNREIASALNLFDFDHKLVQSELKSNSVILYGGKENPSNNQDSKSNPTWVGDSKYACRILLDRIVCLWNPKYLWSQRISINKLHESLTPDVLLHVQKQYVNTTGLTENQKLEEALEIYRSTLVPLHYHELWREIQSDYTSMGQDSKRRIQANAQLFYPRETLQGDDDTYLMFTSIRTIFVDSYVHQVNRISLFDLVLIEVENQRFFGVSVHVEYNKINTTVNSHELGPTGAVDRTNLQVELLITYSIYISKECGDLIKALPKRPEGISIHLQKISNITSQRRMISAIYNVSYWPQYHSLLKPTNDDPYFQLPEHFDEANDERIMSLNEAQSRVVKIAELMADDLQERFHLIHGPPGTGKSRTIAVIVQRLLQNMKRSSKILITAPSNNACDELCRRIIEVYRNEDISLRNKLVRVGCVPPDDLRLADYFFDFIILKDIVDELKSGNYVPDNIRSQKETQTMKKAQIIVSTLNYCGSSRMNTLKHNIDFVIVDEACQSLEADCLLPLRFDCTKIMLVGDPKQLSPCVLSPAGKQYGLSQSLFTRIYDCLSEENPFCISLLDIQYRMDRVICDFPNMEFYADELTTCQSVANRNALFPFQPMLLFNLNKGFDEVNESGSCVNTEEVRLVQELCQTIIQYLAQRSHPDVEKSEAKGKNKEDTSSDSDSSDDESPSLRTTDQRNRFQMNELTSIPNDDPRSIEIQKRIAVITPYKEQINQLRARLPQYIEILTADSAQGKEKDIVIISCVRSNNGSIGFLNDKNRMNVMMTRAKYGLYMVGNFDFLSRFDSTWKNLVSYAREKRILLDAQSVTVSHTTLLKSPTRKPGQLTISFRR